METTDHVLLVDDDRPLLGLLAGYLQQAGCRVSTAGNGAQMRQVLAGHRVDRVVLDHSLRVLSRDQWLSLTLGREADAFDGSIDLLVSRLRRRLREDPRESRWIKAVRNGGYVFCADVLAEAP